MRNELIALFLVFVMIAVAGCGSAPTVADQQTGKTSSTEENTATQGGLAAGQKVGLDKIYKYGMLNSYEYRVASDTADELTMKYTISSDSVDGTQAWLQQSDISVAGTSMISKIWFSKTSYKCLKIETEVVSAGKRMKQPAQCPDEQANTTGTNTIPEVTYIGKESVTVPIGTFNADKYSTEELIYWVGDNIPVPVKVSSNNGKTVMELVSYS